MKHIGFIKPPRARVAVLAGALALSLASALAPQTATAKPIAFAGAWTFMHERDSDMLETDLYYAPTYWFSLGPTVAISRSDDKLTRREAAIFHTNFLVRRWNMPNAQANIFATVGLGKVKTFQFSPSAREPGTFLRDTREETTQHLTVQGDYETRQFYTALKSDTHRASSFLDRTDTFQIGFSPYAHDYEDLAIWFVGQVKKKRGLNDETEGGAFVRLFKKNVWLEVGMTEGRKSQIMLMINY
jgi:hypothetical protein